jgi:hypothetical protein
MQPLGLWNESCRLKITDEGGSSTAVHTFRAPTDWADFVTIDDFVAKNHISHVDFIKLDIEGSELKALEGGRKTIKEMVPSMAISVYHQPDHMYEIILYLAKINSGYNFYLYHHSAGLWETCLYAVLEKNIFIRLWKQISFYLKNKVWRSKRLSKIFLRKNWLCGV